MVDKQNVAEHTGEYHWAVERTGALTCAMTLISLENITPSESRQTQEAR